MVPSATAAITASAEMVFFILLPLRGSRAPMIRRQATPPPNFRRSRGGCHPTWFGRCTLETSRTDPLARSDKCTPAGGDPRASCANLLYSARIYILRDHEPRGCRMRTEDLILVSVDDHVVEP